MLSSCMSWAPLSYITPPQASLIFSIQAGMANTDTILLSSSTQLQALPVNSYSPVPFNLNFSKLTFHASPPLSPMLFCPLFFHTAVISITGLLIYVQDRTPAQCWPQASETPSKMQVFHHKVQWCNVKGKLGFWGLFLLFQKYFCLHLSKQTPNDRGMKPSSNRTSKYGTYLIQWKIRLKPKLIQHRALLWSLTYQESSELTNQTLSLPPKRPNSLPLVTQDCGLWPLEIKARTLTHYTCLLVCFLNGKDAKFSEKSPGHNCRNSFSCTVLSTFPFF